MTDESWIQSSLARLEELEQMRPQLVAQGRTAELAEVDEEIRTLYEVLESVAAQAEDEDEARQPAPPTESAPASPIETTPVVQLAPGVPEPIAPTPSQSFSVMHVRRSRAPMLVAAAVVLVGCTAGGWWLHQQNHAKADAPVVGEPKVIRVGEIPEDTQEPSVARGGEADRTPGIRIREAAEPEPRRRTNKSKTRTRSQAPDQGSSDRKLEVGGSRDPLAGLR